MVDELCRNSVRGSSAVRKVQEATTLQLVRDVTMRIYIYILP